MSYSRRVLTKGESWAKRNCTADRGRKSNRKMASNSFIHLAQRASLILLPQANSASSLPNGEEVPPNPKCHQTVLALAVHFTSRKTALVSNHICAFSKNKVWLEAMAAYQWRENVLILAKINIKDEFWAGYHTVTVGLNYIWWAHGVEGSTCLLSGCLLFLCSVVVVFYWIKSET